MAWQLFVNDIPYSLEAEKKSEWQLFLYILKSYLICIQYNTSCKLFLPVRFKRKKGVHVGGSGWDPMTNQGIFFVALFTCQNISGFQETGNIFRKRIHKLLYIYSVMLRKLL